MAPATSDSLILAASASASAGNGARRGARLLDLGCGSGVVGLSVLARCPGTYLEAVDSDPESVAATIKAARSGGFGRRVKGTHSDALVLGKVRPPQSFDLVLCNPPFFIEGAGRQSPDPARNRARQASEGTIGDWVQAALRLTKQGGAVHFIVPETQADATWYAARRLAKRIQLYPVAFKAEGPAKRVLMIAIRGAGPAKPEKMEVIAFHDPAVRAHIEAGGALWQTQDHV